MKNNIYTVLYFDEPSHSWVCERSDGQPHLDPITFNVVFTGRQEPYVGDRFTAQDLKPIDEIRYEVVGECFLSGKCRCRACLTRRRAIKTVSLSGFALTTFETSDELVGMIVCPKCGNKRCPHATDHKHACTNSNEPGQNGSIY